MNENGPLIRWLRDKNLAQADLAQAADCSSGLISMVARGQKKLTPRLRKFLDEVAPGLSADMDGWFERRTAEVMQKIRAIG